MAPTREKRLPSRRNPLMVEDVPDYARLVALRRLGQTKMTAKMVGGDESESGTLGFFEYVHLRAPLPKGIVSGIFKSSPTSYFLMRRSFDGYISATGMFKATFPYAEVTEEESERRYIKSLETTSPEETAGNVWIPPEEALILADEYHINPWIMALLDPSTVSTAPDIPPKSIAAPPVFDLAKKMNGPLRTKLDMLRAPKSNDPLTPPTTGRRSRNRGPLSPTKSSKRSNKLKVEKSEALPMDGNAEEDDQLRSVPKTSTFEPVIVLETKEESDVKLFTDAGETKRIHSLEVERELLPTTAGVPPSTQEISHMLNAAKKMVKQNGELTKDSSATDKTESEEKSKPRGTLRKTKRKAADISASETDLAEKVSTDTDTKEEQPRTKKARTESEIRKDKAKNRALFGIGATVAVGAVVPWLISLL